MSNEISVRFAEVLTAEEAGGGREGRWMRRFKNEMLVAVDVRAFCFRIITPQHEDEASALLRERADDGVGEEFPAFLLMRASGVRADGQRRVQQENSLLCPAR